MSSQVSSSGHFDGVVGDDSTPHWALAGLDSHHTLLYIAGTSSSWTEQELATFNHRGTEATLTLDLDGEPHGVDWDGPVEQ